jgi:CRISPR-associated protein Cas2
MIVLVCYDVDTTTRAGARRLRRLAQICLDCGIRVQYSVFECRNDEKDWMVVRARLLAEYLPAEDSLRFYFVEEDAARRTEHWGVRRPLDVTGPLIA